MAAVDGLASLSYARRSICEVTEVRTKVHVGWSFRIGGRAASGTAQGQLSTLVRWHLQQAAMHIQETLPVLPALCRRSRIRLLTSDNGLFRSCLALRSCLRVDFGGINLSELVCARVVDLRSREHTVSRIKVALTR